MKFFKVGLIFLLGTLLVVSSFTGTDARGKKQGKVREYWIAPSYHLQKIQMIQMIPTLIPIAHSEPKKCAI